MQLGLKLWLTLHVLFQLLVTVKCANILFFFILGNYSHRLSAGPLIEALAERGHNVTIFAQHKAKNPNPKVHEFSPKVLHDFGLGSKVSFVEFRHKGLHHSLMKHVIEVGAEICELLMADSEVLTWVDQNNFDLLVIDPFVNDCALGLAYKYKVPHILFSTATPYNWQYDEMGVVPETSWIPRTYSEYPADMSFIQRAISTFQPVYWYFYKQWYYLDRIELAVRKGLKLPDMPPLHEIGKNVGVVLVDTYFSTEYARSLPPLVVPIGGMQCWKQHDNTPLPNDIAKFIEDGGSDGFIYISLGSGVKVGDLPGATQKAIFNALKDSNTRFIFRWDAKVPDNLPPNVLTYSWLPQQELLTHPSIKGFITQGGGLSVHEAVCLGVPMIMIPVYGEQDQNANRLVDRGCGLKLEIRGLTYDALHGTIKKFLEDNSFKRNMQKASRVFLDRPMNPIQLAVWWTEYVLRHKETPLLKPRGMYQTWYQRRLLDVWGATFAAITLAVLFLIFLLYKCVKHIPASRKCSGEILNKIKNN